MMSGGRGKKELGIDMITIHYKQALHCQRINKWYSEPATKRKDSF